jgi:kumamolisin
MPFKTYWKPHNYRRPRFGVPEQGYIAGAIGKAYNWPTGITADIPTVWIPELGGAPPSASVASEWCDSVGIPVPNVGIIGTAVPDQGGADVEVALDGYPTVAAGVAYMFGGRAAKFVYVFGPNSDAGMIWCYQQILAACKPGDSASFSWGGPESSYAPATIDSLIGLFLQLINKGVTLTFASGDNGPTDGTQLLVTDFPGSAPWGICCGATTITINSAGLSVSQVPWNSGGGASGGGYSKIIPVPSYQTGIVPAGSSGRGCPDVAINGDPATGYNVPNTNSPVGGTSAAAPMMATLAIGLNALAIQAGKPPLGLGNNIFYANANAATFFQVTTGTIGDGMNAGPGPWNPAAGCGSPNGLALQAIMLGTAPPVTPPVVPPVVPPVTPVGGMTLAQVVSAINTEFAKLEALNPMLRRILVAVNAALVADLTAVWPNGNAAKAMKALAEVYQYENLVYPRIAWEPILQELPMLIGLGKEIIPIAQEILPVVLQIYQMIESRSHPA